MRINDGNDGAYFRLSLEQMAVFEHPGKKFSGDRGVLIQQQEPWTCPRFGKLHGVVVGARCSYVPTGMVVVAGKRKINLIEGFWAVVEQDDPNGVQQPRIAGKNFLQAFDGLTLLRQPLVKYNHGYNLALIHVRSNAP